MKNTSKFRWLSKAFGCAAMAVAACSTANAGSITQPGETAGLAIGAPLPVGVYFVNTLSDGGFRGVDDHKSDLLVDIPVLAVSTPYQILGGRVWGYIATPYVSFGVPDSRDFMAMYNPFFGAGLAWDLGGGWGFSNIVGAYAPVDNELRHFGHNVWVFNNRAALSYTGNKWNLTAHVIYGATGDDENTGLRVAPDYLNYDLTAVKTLGKWQVGAVAFGSTDLENFAYGVGQCNHRVRCAQAQFAVGGLIGYDFPGITTQLYATSDVWTDNYRNADGSKSYETRVWTRVVIPLWSPPKMESLK